MRPSLVLTFGGLRRSEVAGVAWEDISLEGVFYNEVSLAVLQSISFEHVVAFRNQLASEGYKRSSSIMRLIILGLVAEDFLG